MAQFGTGSCRKNCPQPPQLALSTPRRPPHPRRRRRRSSIGGWRRSATCATSGRACSPPRPGGWPTAAPTPPRSSTLTFPAGTCREWIWGCSRTCRGSATGRAASWRAGRSNAVICFYQPTRRW